MKKIKIKFIMVHFGQVFQKHRTLGGLQNINTGIQLSLGMVEKIKKIVNKVEANSYKKMSMSGLLKSKTIRKGYYQNKS